MRRFPLLSFFVLACLLSWLAWAPLVATSLGWSTMSVSRYLHLVGGFGPLIAALIVVGHCNGRVGLKQLWSRIIDVRGRLGSISIAVAAPICLLAVSAFLLNISGQGHFAGADIGKSVEYPDLNRSIYWLASLVCYGFGEEVGWRGFALPRLQAGRTALTSALFLSGAWAIWHLPLFAFSSGMSNMGLAEVAGWMSSLVTGSVLMTWLFNRSRGSVLAVALFHGVLDIVMTSPVKGALPSVMGAIITLWGLSIPFVLGRKDLSRSPRVRDPHERMRLKRQRAGGWTEADQ